MRKSTLSIILAGAVAAAIPAFAQQDFRSDAAVQATGSFVKDTTENNVEHTATSSGGILATYRLGLGTHNAVEFNYGYARNTQAYAGAAGAFGQRINTHEATAAYVYRLPYKRIAPFALAGAEALVFDVPDAVSRATQARAAFVYGAGIDVNLTSRLFLRAQYRGQVYETPTFEQAAFGPERITHRAQPSAGFGFRF